jgi:polyhydroxybutyrate depolymerase
MKLCLIVPILILATSVVQAEEKKSRGWLRDGIISRMVKKAEEQPPPIASTDVTTKIENAGDFTYAIQFEGRTRYYMVHVPKKYSPAKPSPVLLALHGGLGSMKVQATDEYYKQISKSEQIGFIAVFPNGISKFKSGSFATWNAGNCCANARDENVDDVGFLKQIVKNLVAQVNVDKKRVFATGMSNGAMMAYRLACEAPDVFKGIAAVAGTDNTKSCRPTIPIPVLHIHAKDDERVLFEGHAGKTFGDDPTAVTDFVSVAASTTKWAKLNSCKAKPTRVLEVKGAHCDRYSDCKAAVELCVTETGGHSWPGGKKPMKGATPSTAISANDVMWDFFNSEIK